MVGNGKASKAVAVGKPETNTQMALALEGAQGQKEDAKKSERLLSCDCVKDRPFTIKIP